MSPTLAKITKALRELRKREAMWKESLERAERELAARHRAFDNAPDSLTAPRMLQDAQNNVDNFKRELQSTQGEIGELVAQELAEIAAEKALQAGGAAAERGALWRIASWVGSRLGLGAAGGGAIIIVTLGAATIGVARIAGDWSADRATQVGPAISNRTLAPGQVIPSGAVQPPASATRKFVVYKLVEAKISKVPATTVVPIETWETSLPASIDLSVSEPTYSSKGTITIKAPPEVKGDHEKFDLSAQVNVTFDLKQGTHNLNTGVNLAGRGSQTALPKTEGGALAVGSHSLTAQTSFTTDFATDSFIRKWEEDGKLCRSITVGCHTGIVQRLSGCTVILKYQQQ